MPGQDFGLPRPDGTGQPGQLRHLDAVCPPVQAVQRGVRRRHGGRGVDGAEQLLALPGRGHLTTRVPGGKAGT
jgi:hypothetical protein